MKKPFLANFEVNLENSKPDESIGFGSFQTDTSRENSDPDESICGFTQRTRTTEDSDADESII